MWENMWNSTSTYH